MALKLSDIKHYNIFLLSIEQALYVLISSDFQRPLSENQGLFLYQYIDEKVQKIEVPEDVRGGLWTKVITSYRKKYKDVTYMHNGEIHYLINQDLRENKTCLNLFKGELVRWYIQQNKEILEKIWEQ